MRLLFICSRNRLRSPTAQQVFGAYDGIETASAGLNHDADTTVSGDLLEWADIVFVMERQHLNRLQQRFQSVAAEKKVVVLGVPDRYEFMDPDLVALLKRRVSPYLERSL
jgi:predicted protein tyrosine phosphatase